MSFYVVVELLVQKYWLMEKSLARRILIASYYHFRWVPNVLFWVEVAYMDGPKKPSLAVM
jgi:hypothetical protein